ncbi:MAG: helix-turn-helix transcriptional regulator [Candidatus Ornithomonoglobus sp.]
MSFENRIKSAREKKSLSQQELATLLDVTDGTISNYEKGVAFPRWDKIRLLCEILEVDPNYLFWDDLSENLKNKILNNNNDNSKSGKVINSMYDQLDPEDKAEIRGEMKQMLKAEKYNKTSIGDEIAEDITKLMNMRAHTNIK